MAQGKGLQLSLQTMSLVAGFMVWVLLSSLMSFIKQDISLTAGQISLITAAPVILGSIFRVPFGYYANRFGARIIFITGLLFLVLPVGYLGIADGFFDLLLAGIFLGIGGALFSVGVTSLPKYYPKEKHGFVNGIYGVGNIGTAITSFGAPIIAGMFGWRQAVFTFIIPLILFAVLNFILGDRKEPKVETSLKDQILSVYKNNKLWFLSFFYFLTFGSFVALTVYLPNFLVSEFQLTEVDAGLRTAVFVALCTLLRPVGGILGDKFNPFKVLMVVFAGLTISGVLLSFSPTILLYTIGSLSVAIFSGIGNGTIFKLVPLYFTKQAGIVNGIVAAMGGIGGFFPPIILTIVHDINGHYAIGFMALSQFALASLIIIIWMYYTDKLNLSNYIVNNAGQGILVTDENRRITKTNKAFQHITGYSEDEVIGHTPFVLSSGVQDEAFYEEMWKQLRANGIWQGEIINKRKDGELYKQWLSISALKDAGNNITNYVGIFSEMKEKEKV
ncbi:MFS transporter, NNP family, nitrate/nitrite transporter [Gracilibacillus ureilyticus]|uniref:MFS transporter, NNP family, nitrate/nitrite transporter n=1 Tax=Gracilibacillus ureilyticus TaxID=531814 RepID=A0A1H9QV13_9BACI|nr:nitrate/nitrite transporter [Gracilibacillus ureilyticus]SER64312.1 MFS transporter, NNP family, nitrate/nitrite transporter [Gracilibacillus ureilyticus]